MIDWITAVIPLHHEKFISGGNVISIDNQGEIQWNTVKRIEVEGSYSSKVFVKTDDENMIYVTGNPTKFLQGHNIFGTNDLLALNFAFFQSIAHILRIKPSPSDLDSWRLGVYQLITIDITESYQLKSQSDVQAWLRAAQTNISGKHQGASAYSGQTVYIGQNSRRISTKLYNKRKELDKHKLPNDLPYREKLINFTENLLRLEVRIHSQELKRRNINKASIWDEKLIRSIQQERIMKIRSNQKFRLTPNELMDLPPRLVSVYHLWTDGHDIKSMYPPRTYYRYRGDLLKNGIDISCPRPKKAEVIPLIKYLTAEHVSQVPTWAQDTPIYFESRTNSLTS